MVLILKDKVLESFLQWYFGEKKSCPPLTNENNFLAKSAVELAASVRKGDISSTELIQATINRINEVNKVLNAVVDGPFTEALEEARIIDDRIANKKISAGNSIYFIYKTHLVFFSDDNVNIMWFSANMNY